MRKIILPIVIALALVVAVGASSYSAYVGMNTLADVTGTGSANLAFASAGDPVANDFVETDALDPLQVQLNFGDVQPNSTYGWNQVLKVTNNEEFAVNVKVNALSGDILNIIAGTNQSGPGYLRVTIGDYSPIFWNTYIDSSGAPSSTTAGGGATVADGVTLAPGASIYVSFTLYTPYDFSPPGSYTGVITFVGNS